MAQSGCGDVVHLNVGGQRFSTSTSTLTWVPDSFFTSLLSGRIATVEDGTGAKFIDRDPELFRHILNYLRTQQIDLRLVNLSMLKHEAQFYGITPLVKRLSLCEEMDESACGNIFYHGTLPLPRIPTTTEPPVKRPLRSGIGAPTSTLHSNSDATGNTTSPISRLPAKFQSISVFSNGQNQNQNSSANGAGGGFMELSSPGGLGLGGAGAAARFSFADDGPGPSSPPSASGASLRATVPRVISPDHGCEFPTLHSGRQGVNDVTRQIKEELSSLVRQSQRKLPADSLRVRIIRAHHVLVAVAYLDFVACYRLKENVGWHLVYTTPRMPAHVSHIAVLGKMCNQAEKLAVVLADSSVYLWALEDNADTDAPRANKLGTFLLDVPVDKLFFIGSQLVALCKSGKVGIWHSMSQNWQVQDVIPISCFDTAGSVLLLGCTNGSIYYIDMQKFPLRMKDNDLLITELYRDPNADVITAISVYLTQKTHVCGNWIEIAYGTSSGAVRVIVQHPETVGHGPQLFQTFTVHTSPITKVALTTNYLISVCAEYNHVRTWTVTRFRGMISTQPGGTSLASFKVLTLDDADDAQSSESCDAGPYGDQEADQIFIQHVIPDTNVLFIRQAKNGDRICKIKSLEAEPITAFFAHECEVVNRMCRPKRYLFTGTAHGTVQLWDLTAAIDCYHSRVSALAALCGGTDDGDKTTQAAASQTSSASVSGGGVTSSAIATLVKMQATNPRFAPILQGPTTEEFLQIIDGCEICLASHTTTPSITPQPSHICLQTLERNGRCA